MRATPTIDAPHELRLNLLGLKSLKILELHGLRLRDEDLAFLAHSPLLRELDLQTEALSGTFLRHLAKLTNLDRFYVTRLSDCTGEDLAQLNGLTKLRDLHLTGHIPSDALASLTGPKALQSLDVNSDESIPRRTLTNLIKSHPMQDSIRLNLYSGVRNERLETELEPFFDEFLDALDTVHLDGGVQDNILLREVPLNQPPGVTGGTRQDARLFAQLVTKRLAFGSPWMNGAGHEANPVLEQRGEAGGNALRRAFTEDEIHPPSFEPARGVGGAGQFDLREQARKLFLEVPSLAGRKNWHRLASVPRRRRRKPHLLRSPGAVRACSIISLVVRF